MAIKILTAKEAREELPKILKPGDVGCERGESGISKAIRFFTRYRGEPKTYSNHSFIVGSGWNIVEALFRVRSRTITEWPFPREFEIWRHCGLGELDRRAIALEAESFEGQIYGALKIVPHALDGVMGKVFGKDVYLFRPLIGIKKFPICSWLVSWSYWTVVEYEFGVPAERACPDRLHDHVSSNMLLWKRIVRRGPHGLFVVYYEED